MTTFVDTEKLRVVELVLAAQADVQGMHYSGCCNLDLSLLSIG